MFPYWWTRKAYKNLCTDSRLKVETIFSAKKNVKCEAKFEKTSEKDVFLLRISWHRKYIRLIYNNENIAVIVSPNPIAKSIFCTACQKKIFKDISRIISNIIIGVQGKNNLLLKPLKLQLNTPCRRHRILSFMECQESNFREVRTFYLYWCSLFPLTSLLKYFWPFRL